MGHENVSWLEADDREDSDAVDMSREIGNIRAEFSGLKDGVIKDVVVKFDGQVILQLEDGRQVRFSGMVEDEIGDEPYVRSARVTHNGGRSKEQNLGEIYSPVQDEKFLAKFVDAYADELEAIATQPEGRFSAEALEMVNRFRTTKKLPKANKDFYGVMVRIGQDFRLTPDEIDALAGRFLE